MPLFQSESKCETILTKMGSTMQVHFYANQTHFHKNGFALRLALKQRHKGTQKWPIHKPTGRDNIDFVFLGVKC